MAVLAHPDDESLGLGGTLAKYAAAGAEVVLVTATRGDAGRFNGYDRSHPRHPGRERLGIIREAELRAAARVLGIREVSVLGYPDQSLDRVNPPEAIARIAAEIRRWRPDVVVTFGPDGAYGHPDHIAISQFTTAAVVAAADPAFGRRSGSAIGDPHAVAKLYYLAWEASTWRAYESAVRKLTVTVDGGERQATAWPDWAITTAIDTTEFWPVVWQAVSCHASQLGGYQRLAEVSPEHHRTLWGTQTLHRAFSLVNGGRARETDLFEGLRR